ncbi:hypothetical protein PINS_up002040 [Pythium insidiosum]|nr:hypothetical protein PINS_up002040 [Pythium insidiosum]
MGAALATNGLADTSIYDHVHLQQLELLSEYTVHSIKPLQECAQIFLGTTGAGDPDEEPLVDVPSTRLSVATTTRSAATVVYPRQLSLSQFEEVFGMLVADVDPHFEFFEELSVGTGSSASDAMASTVFAHYVFCSVALLVRAEIQVKIAFLLKLYADRHGQLSDERKRTLLRDFLIALHHTLSLTERVDNGVVSVLEKVFWSGDDTRATSIREMYDMCFTNARVSGYLHAVQSIVQEFASARSAAHVRLPASDVGRAGASDGDSLRFLHRSASLLYSTPAMPLLWSMRAREFGGFWRKPPVLVRSDTLVLDVLDELSTHRALAVVVGDAYHGGSTDFLSTRLRFHGHVSLDNLFLYFMDLLYPPSSAAAFSSSQELPSRHLFASKFEVFEETTINVVLAHLRATESGVSTRRPSPSLFQCISDLECWFNVVLRFACGVESVAVLRGSTSTAAYRQTHSGSSSVPQHNDTTLLGCLSVFDILEWLQQDLPLLSSSSPLLRNADGLREHVTIVCCL